MNQDQQQISVNDSTWLTHAMVDQAIARECDSAETHRRAEEARHVGANFLADLLGPIAAELREREGLPPVPSYARPVVHDAAPEAPRFTCFTLAQAVSEASSAMAACKLTMAERIDCERTLAICRQHVLENA